MTLPLTSLTAMTEDYATRAAAARADAQTYLDLAEEAITPPAVPLKFTDPLYAVAWQVRDRCLEMAEVFTDLAGTFENYALADHIESEAQVA